MFWWHLDLETLGIPLGGSLGLGMPFCEISLYIFRMFSISPILNIITAENRFENFSEDFFFNFILRSTPRDFRANLV